MHILSLRWRRCTSARVVSLSDASVDRPAEEPAILTNPFPQNNQSPNTGLGSSTVALAWNAMAPPFTAASWVRASSGLVSSGGRGRLLLPPSQPATTVNLPKLLAAPFFASTSTAMSAVSVAIGIDYTSGKPLSTFAAGSACLTGAVVLVFTGRALMLNKRLVIQAHQALRQGKTPPTQS